MAVVSNTPPPIYACSTDEQRIARITLDLSDPTKLWGEMALWCAGIDNPLRLMRRIPGLSRFKRKIKDCAGERHTEWAWRKAH